ncbi:sensor histidine kinase [Microseira wollei]|uniref:Oxygen sensor histidine kinase NreB n=1 Tax=Microseira wollei NIES-4236 TaxID=2530354 RepID=A0AAV3XKX9_9CYAN|nr:sensor histidine kinase [Microseira wollei]GET41700.1 integral membrane sensor signal transduction histidine kinase [Microseira wollei NIES-4236]
MISILKFQPNPIRLLLYTEWVMLASCASLAVMELLDLGYLPVQHILILALLGLMGLRLPSGSTSVKVLYTTIEVGLVFYGTVLGYLHILPTLYLIVVIRSCFIFELPGRWIVASLSFILFTLHQVQYVKSITPLVMPEGLHRFWMHQLSELLMFALGLLFVMQFVNTLIAERRMQQQLALAHEQLREYALQIEDYAAVQERNRIARDIHDSLGQALTALNIQLQTAAKLWQVNPEQAKSFLKQAQRLGETAIKEVRQSVSALRVDAPEEKPLAAEIASLVEDCRQATGISISTRINLGATLPSPVVKTLYRLVQEALTNICKHAQATEVQIQLDATPEQVSLTVEDNGRGFNCDSKTTGFGLQGMRERVAALQGNFQLKTEPGAGCRITVELPLREVAK